MKRIFIFFSAVIFVLACESNRPDGGSSSAFTYAISGQSILTDGEIKIISDDDDIVARGQTDETGYFEISDIKSLGNISVHVCKGEYQAGDTLISFSGCLKNSFEVEDKKQYSVIVDFISTFITAYESDTDRQEWYDYLDISGSVFPEEENSLTDSAKAWLFTQGLIKTAQDASDIDSAGETLLEKLLDDLKDNNTIDGSTDETIGSISVGENIFRKMIPQSIEKLYDSDKTADWREHLETADADFLGAESESEEKSISIKIYQGESGTTEADYYHGTITVKATAENFSTVKDFSCIHDGSIGELSDENDADKHFEAVVDISELENGSYTVSCELSDDSQLYDEEKTYTVDNNAPEISISIYKEGTKEETGTEESPARGSVDMVAQASHKNYEIEDMYCSIDEKSLTDTEDAKDKVKSTVDTTTFPEGENTVICTALVNNTEYNAQSALHIENRADVTIKPFIAYPLIPTNNTKVTYSDSEGNESVAEIGDNNITASLQLGKTYTVDVMNGQYRSVTLSEDESDLKTYSGRLSARVTVSEDTSEVIVTPMTSISQRLYESILENAPSRDAEAESISLIEGHYGSGQLNLTTVPNNNKTNDISTRAFIAGAAFEELAYYISTVELDTDPGTIPVSQIMNIFYDELENDVLLDGFNDTSSLAITDGDKVFPVDSYLYRKFYAIAIKNFLNSDRNPTTLNALQSMVNNTAENDSILFPDDKPPVPVNLDGPEVEISEFQVLWNNEKVEEEWQETETYDPESQAIPVFNHGFKITFSVTPDAEENQILDVDFTDISAPKDNDVFDIIRIEPQSADDFTQSTVEYVYEIVPSEGAEAMDVSNLDFSITVTDTAYNETTALIQTVWDGMPPQVGVVVPEHPVRPEDGIFTWNIEEEHIYSLSGKAAVDSDGNPSNGYEYVTTWPDIMSVTQLNIQDFYLNDTGQYEGEYVVSVTATDTAGNIGSGEGVITVDTTPPIPDFSMMDEYQRLIKDNSGTRAGGLTVSYKEESGGEDPPVFWKASINCEGGSTFDYSTTWKDIDVPLNLDTLPYNDTCTVSVLGEDQAGNQTAPGDATSYTFYIDNTEPNMSDRQSLTNNPVTCMMGNCFPMIRFLCSPEEEGQEVPGTSGAITHFRASDNVTDIENLDVYIKNTTIGGDYVPCTLADMSNCDTPQDDRYYCFLTGNNGNNSFSIKIVDELGNVYQENFSENLVLDGPDTPQLTLSTDQITDTEGVTINWTADSEADSTNCKISKDGESWESDCNNGQTIYGSGLNGSGTYIVTVKSFNAAGSSQSEKAFTYTDTSEISIHTYRNGSGAFKQLNSFSVASHKDNWHVEVDAKTGLIDTIKLYITDGYVHGIKETTNDFLIYEVQPRGFGNIKFSEIEASYLVSYLYDAEDDIPGGQYRKIKTVVTLEGGQTISKTESLLNPLNFIGNEESNLFSLSFSDIENNCDFRNEYNDYTVMKSSSPPYEYHSVDNNQGADKYYLDLFRAYRITQSFVVSYRFPKYFTDDNIVSYSINHGEKTTEDSFSSNECSSSFSEPPSLVYQLKEDEKYSDYSMSCNIDKNDHRHICTVTDINGSYFQRSDDGMIRVFLGFYPRTTVSIETTRYNFFQEELPSKLLFTPQCSDSFRLSLQQSDWIEGVPPIDSGHDIQMQQNTWISVCDNIN